MLVFVSHCCISIMVSEPLLGANSNYRPLPLSISFLCWNPRPLPPSSSSLSWNPPSKSTPVATVDHQRTSHNSFWPPTNTTQPPTTTTKQSLTTDDHQRPLSSHRRSPRSILWPSISKISVVSASRWQIEYLWHLTSTSLLSTITGKPFPTTGDTVQILVLQFSWVSVNKDSALLCTVEYWCLLLDFLDFWTPSVEASCDFLDFWNPSVEASCSVVPLSISLFTVIDWVILLIFDQHVGW